MSDSITLSPYNKDWPNQFELARHELSATFPGEFIAIEHIGSTAIPGISAKPIIDILAGVTSMKQADQLIPRLLECGWDTSEEFNRRIGERRFLLKWPRRVRTHHLHLVIFEGPLWHPCIIFRDRLRHDASLRSQYESLKLSLAIEFPEDRESYTKSKEGFIRKVVEGYSRAYQG